MKGYKLRKIKAPPPRDIWTYIGMVFLIAVVVALSITISVQEDANRIQVAEIEQLKEEIIWLELDLGTTTIEKERFMRELAEGRGKIEDLEETAIVHLLVIDYAKEVLTRLDTYVGFLYAVMDQNQIGYPEFVMPESAVDHPLGEIFPELGQDL